MKILSAIISSVIIFASAILCQQIISNSFSEQNNKKDYAELNNVKYGLFSVDEWKKQVTVILGEEINKLSLSGTTKRELRKHIEVLLNTLIDKVYKIISEGSSGSSSGLVRQTFVKMFINLDDIKKGIPEYTDAIMHEITKPKTKGQIKALLNKEVQQYFSETFNVQDTSQLDRILLATGSKDIESARAKLNEEISAQNGLIFKEAVLLIILSVVLFAWFGFSKQPLTSFRHILLVLSLVILLAAGVTTPMIDLEAKISRMSFILMGHPIQFENQVLYFQSKSILDVFWIMITHKDIQMKFVGVLLITFSIVFPLFKIFSLLAYYYDYHHARKNRAVKFFVLKSGKWSMADVMVIAIFMAYIGFRGIITSQLDQLSSAAKDLDILTTNGTSLQPGYYLFITYTLLALISAEFIIRNPQVNEHKKSR
jgi:hypothetical protein